MTDVLDEILDHLSPSTLEIVQNYGDNSIQDSKNLDQLLAEFQEIRLGQMTKELQRRCLNIKYKSAENSQILTKLLKDLKLQESLNTSCDYNQRIEALMKQLNAYNVNLTLLDTPAQRFSPILTSFYTFRRKLRSNQRMKGA